MGLSDKKSVRVVTHAFKIHFAPCTYEHITNGKKLVTNLCHSSGVNLSPWYSSLVSKHDRRKETILIAVVFVRPSGLERLVEQEPATSPPSSSPPRPRHESIPFPFLPTPRASIIPRIATPHAARPPQHTQPAIGIWHSIPSPAHAPLPSPSFQAGC